MTKKVPGAKEGRPSLRTAQRAEAWCEEYIRTAHIGRACKKVGVSRWFVFRWRAEDPVFARMWREAQKVGTSLLEDEAHRRGIEGWLRPIYQGGRLVGQERNYSDVMLGLMLSARDPEKYRRNVALTHEGNIGIVAMTEEQVNARIAELLAITGIVGATGSKGEEKGEE